MKSSKATIISSFLLIILTQANIGDLTMANNAIFPLILTIISLIFAFLSVVGVEKKDLMQVSVWVGDYWYFELYQSNSNRDPNSTERIGDAQCHWYSADFLQKYL